HRFRSFGGRLWKPWHYAVHGWHRVRRHHVPLQVAQPAAEFRVQFLHAASAATSAAPATSAAATGAATGDADVPGRLGHPGDGHLPSATASSPAAATGAGTRISADNHCNNRGLGESAFA